MVSVDVKRHVYLLYQLSYLIFYLLLLLLLLLIYSVVFNGGVGGGGGGGGGGLSENLSVQKHLKQDCTSFLLNRNSCNLTVG